MLLALLAAAIGGGATAGIVALLVTDVAEMHPVTSVLILTLIAMWALADYSFGAAEPVAAAWRVITAIARLAVRLTARAPVGRVMRFLTYMLIAFGIFARVQSVPRAGASEPLRSAVLAARRLINTR